MFWTKLEKKIISGFVAIQKFSWSEKLKKDEGSKKFAFIISNIYTKWSYGSVTKSLYFKAYLSKINTKFSSMLILTYDSFSLVFL